MQVATILLNIGGDAGNQVPKYNVTPSEVHVLQLLHGSDAVNEIEITGDEKRTSKQERERLVHIYAQPQPNGERRSPAIDTLFPGVAARLYENFSEMDLEDHVYKGGNGPVEAKKKDPLDHDGDGKKGGAVSSTEEGLEGMTIAKLKEYAEKNRIDLGSASKKDDIIAAIRSAEDERRGQPDSDDVGANDGDNDGIEDMPDTDQNLFE